MKLKNAMLTSMPLRVGSVKAHQKEHHTPTAIDATPHQNKQRLVGNEGMVPPAVTKPLQLQLKLERYVGAFKRSPLRLPPCPVGQARSWPPMLNNACDLHDCHLCVDMNAVYR